ncbi:MAG: EVE domain-containing protein [Alkalilacustris sp.]
MGLWLMKSEPDVFSWDDLVAKGAAGEAWDGVRNYQARNHMRAMAVGDRAFFYHSRQSSAVVGICEVIAEAHPDPTTDDPRWECVDVRALAPLRRPVRLSEIRAEPALAEMVLVRNARLSVQPVRPTEWDLICAMADRDG